MTRSEYLLKLIELLTADEILKSAQNPTRYMSKTHIALHHIALRRIA